MIDFSKLHYNGDEHESVFTRSPRGSLKSNQSPYFEGGGSMSGSQSMKDEENVREDSVEEE